MTKEEKAENYVSNNTDSEVRRMHGHHFRSYLAGYNQALSDIEKLNKSDVSGQLPLDFVKWYSGMDKDKILKAYERWIIESGSTV